MKSIIFDTGPIISLATNNLLWVLGKLKKNYNVSFQVPLAVKKELIDKPLRTKKFKLEALQVMQIIRNDILEVIDEVKVVSKADELCDLCNNVFYARGSPLRLVHPGEMEALAAAIIFKADSMIIDERTTRMIVEEPERLLKIFKRRLHTEIKVDKKNLNKILNEVRGIRLLRSTELMAIAFELGIMDDFIPNETKEVPEPRKTLLDAILWGLKIRGCAISEKEIHQIIKYVL